MTGAPGAGKSTFASAEQRRLRELGIRAVVLPMDGFHLPQAELARLGRRDRMGAPDTFDVAAFVSALSRVRAGGPVRAPAFDRTVEEPVPEAVHIPSNIRVVIVEGNYLLHDRDGWQNVRPLLDEVVFLGPDDTARTERLLARHVRFGKTPSEAAEWVARVDEPNAALVATTAVRADRVLREPFT